MPAPTKITFHYIKSPHFDEHPLHGVYGGLLPQGLYMALFSERRPIPQELDAELIPVEGESDTYTLNEIEKRGKQGMIRSVHAAYYFDLDFAESLITWLQDRVAEAKKLGIS